jgi:hypothetical protein
LISTQVLIDLHPSRLVPRADLLDLRLTLTLARHRDGRCCTVCYDAPFRTGPPRFDIAGPQGCLSLARVRSFPGAFCSMAWRYRFLTARQSERRRTPDALVDFRAGPSSATGTRSSATTGRTRRARASTRSPTRSSRPAPTP